MLHAGPRAHANGSAASGVFSLAISGYERRIRKNVSLRWVQSPLLVRGSSLADALRPDPAASTNFADRSLCQRTAQLRAPRASPPLAAIALLTLDAIVGQAPPDARSPDPNTGGFDGGKAGQFTTTDIA
ncbi:hypothetical protein CHELA1G11_12774 [Hyphomicrobiales bacterium]|nr:hypothetical protein CHELA1G2_11535 [Hyphomicrobiales bacterium]CAH1667025.1 hypothetical protein CHELA1G11_12774 [Hyphomicrobiales bacterium]